MESHELMSRVREALLSKKAANVLVFDVRKTSPVTDYYMIASGATAAQLKAMSNAVIHVTKECDQATPRASGKPEDGWVVLDLFDVVIHIFQEEVRSYYSIEELWEDCPQVK